ncbi:MerR family transcriptional regulator [Sphingomonas sp. ID0503]|uniref:MerR family transcriptional regulator n=1 Tax=Sphingomonas sp. ID0503 TaxID=3399691 RepID=UPI003AFACB2B
MRELEEKSGVDREVIRILLRKGLLPEPTRLARNQADYDETHVRAIMVIRELQKGSRLTLDQIKELMDGNGLDSGAGATTYQHLEELLAIRFGLDETRLVPLTSISERNVKAEADAQVFDQMGMVDLVADGSEAKLSLTDARLVEIWAQVRDLGFVEETGFPPENIAFYMKAAEEVAAKEAEIFLKGSAGRISEESAAKMLQGALPLMLDFFGLLRLKAFMRNIHEAVDPAKSRDRPVP